jgi:hypothetical protein
MNNARLAAEKTVEARTPYNAEEGGFRNAPRMKRFSFCWNALLIG